MKMSTPVLIFVTFTEEKIYSRMNLDFFSGDSDDN